MEGFQTLLYGCKKQLANTDIKFESIDYGFKMKKTLPLVYASWPTWQKALVTMGIIISGILTLTLPCCCCS
jgi:hypothetical protein